MRLVSMVSVPVSASPGTVCSCVKSRRSAAFTACLSVNSARSISRLIVAVGRQVKTCCNCSKVDLTQLRIGWVLVVRALKRVRWCATMGCSSTVNE